MWKPDASNASPTTIQRLDSLPRNERVFLLQPTTLVVVSIYCDLVADTTLHPLCEAERNACKKDIFLRSPWRTFPSTMIYIDEKRFPFTSLPYPILHAWIVSVLPSLRTSTTPIQHGFAALFSVLFRVPRYSSAGESMMGISDFNLK
jgi:hypothetical protein